MKQRFLDASLKDRLCGRGVGKKGLGRPRETQKLANIEKCYGILRSNGEYERGITM